MLRAALLTAAGLALATACASPGDGSLDTPDSPVARYDWDQTAAMEALLEGLLELRGECLYVGGTVAAFPRSLASWDPAREVLTYAGIEYALGDVVSAGGGSAASLRGVAIPAGCELQPGDLGGEVEVFLVQDEDLEPYAR